MYFMPATSGTYYIDVADPYPLSTSETYTVAVATTTADYTDNPTAPGSVVVNASCFAHGTRISTERGEIAVEHLRIGDLVPTQFAGTAPIKWIGHRHVDCRRHPKPQKVWPVRVRAGAFGHDMPRRDVLLSPDHAAFINDVLIPIRHLVNGATIRQEQVDEIVYWHVELEQHDVILAEGLPCESFLDIGNRGTFINGGRATQLHPDFSVDGSGTARVWEAYGCAPLAVTGEPLQAARSRLLTYVKIQSRQVEQCVAHGA
jgi:hypothetical protein